MYVYICVLNHVLYAFPDIIFNLTYELMQTLPKDFKRTAESLRQHLSDEEFSDIMSSPNYKTGNQRIITTLIRRLSHGEDLFKFFDILELIEDAPYLPVVIESFKNSKF